MSATTGEAVAAHCSYCGRENTDRLAACAGCGTPLVSPTPAPSEPKQKSKFLAVCLALAFGPLGLFYASISGAIVIMLIAVPFIISGTGGYWVSIGVRLVCAVWAVHALSHGDVESDPASDTAQLLDQAARLESVDRDEAVAAYQEIVRLFPDTPASKEAARNIQVLKRQA